MNPILGGLAPRNENLYYVRKGLNLITPSLEALPHCLRWPFLGDGLPAKDDSDDEKDQEAEGAFGKGEDDGNADDGKNQEDKKKKKLATKLLGS